MRKDKGERYRIQKKHVKKKDRIPEKPLKKELLSINRLPIQEIKKKRKCKE